MSPINPNTIEERLNWLLSKTDMTQRELARRSGLAETQISIILKRLKERPHSIEVETVYKIAAGAGVRAEWLLTGHGTPTAEQGTDRTRLCEMPVWATLLRFAKQLPPQYPPWVWDWVGDVHLPASTAANLSPGALHHLAALGYAMLALGQPVQPTPPSARSPRARKK